MKTTDIFKLQKGDKINHKHYGVCVVDSIIPEFGPCIIPETKEGLTVLRHHFGCSDGTPLLESSFRLISGIVVS